MSERSEPVGTLEVALAHAERLLEKDPGMAACQADEILRVIPGYPAALFLLGRARRRGGEPAAALEVLQPLRRAHPDWAEVVFETAMAAGAAGQGEEAVQLLRHALGIRPELQDGWRILGDHLTVMGDVQGADEAYARHIRYSTHDPRLLEPAVALCEGRIAVAETLLRRHLMSFPTDVTAIRMLSEVAGRLGRYGDAEILLQRCLELAPGFSGARHNLALVLLRQNRPTEALAEIDSLLATDAANPGFRNLKAAILARLGEYQGSIAIYAGVLAEYPNQPKLWMSYGHALKTAGNQVESITAYRRSLDLRPQFGEAYWSLANLKTFRFTRDEIHAMQSRLSGPGLEDEDRFHFHFAIGKALEDAGEYEQAFHHYQDANRLRRKFIRYDADETSDHVRRSKALFTREFFRERENSGAPADDPIFIVGLPRAGSTLLEQILASHPDVEGTMELPDIMAIARALGEKKTRRDTSLYPEILAGMNATDFLTLGDQYLSRTRIQRKSGRPRFIDKMPNNFAHIGLIHLALPRARIIDARRHPMACCFSGFKQHFARGQNFTYSLEEIGRYYMDYVALMDHFDEVLPGRVLRVHYEAVVEDTEAQVRRVLDYCGLPFDPGCLRFYESDRAVRTASSEQVRTPIFREGLDQWQHFEPWLGTLAEMLAPLNRDYPRFR